MILPISEKAVMTRSADVSPGLESRSSHLPSLRSKKLLTAEDARQIAVNMTGFFRAAAAIAGPQVAP